MLEFLRGRASRRKLRLFACACWRAWHASVLWEDILRDIFGNPFHPPPPIAPAGLQWNDCTIPKLALCIYDELVLPSGHLDKAQLGVLADALEEAGVTDPDILGHLRAPGPHVRGCWPVDLLLGKE
jgi:hypothetical protein